MQPETDWHANDSPNYGGRKPHADRPLYSRIVPQCLWPWLINGVAAFMHHHRHRHRHCHCRLIYVNRYVFHEYASYGLDGHQRRSGRGSVPNLTWGLILQVLV